MLRLLDKLVTSIVLFVSVLCFVILFLVIGFFQLILNFVL